MPSCGFIILYEDPIGMRKIRWIIFASQIPALLIGTGLYIIFWFTIRREWPGISALIFWIFWVIVMWVSWKEERMDLEYWIKPAAGEILLKAIAEAGFKEVYHNDGVALFRFRKPWRQSYFAILRKEPTLIKLEIAGKFEEKIDAHITPDMLFRAKPVPDRRHWLLRALYTAQIKKGAS